MTNETLTLHSEHIDTAVEALRENGEGTVANTIEAQRGNAPTLDGGES